MPISGLEDAETARDIISLAFREAGVLGVGQTLLAEDINDGFTYFKRMIAVYQKNRWLVPSLYDLATVGNSLISNKIGNGQFWNAPRPDKIQAGYTVQRNTGGTPVSLPLYPIFSYEDYARITIKNLNTVPRYYFYDGAFPFGNLFIWPIPNSSWENHIIIKSQLGFATSIEDGTLNNSGTGFTDGIYVAVPLIGGSGISATANVTVAGGIVTGFALQNPGEGYKVNDNLTLDTDVIGNGIDFSWTVDLVTSNLDSVMDLPPEYMEALHYNLAIRLCSGWQVPANEDTKRLAKASLNTIRKANTQVPALRMPPTLQLSRNGFNIYNPDNY